MKTIFHRSSPPPNSPSRFAFTPPRSPLHHTFSESLMEENIEIAESIITKWDPNPSSDIKIHSMFRDDRYEAKQYLKSVKDLQTAMHFLALDMSISDKIVHAQRLMQIAMQRLQKEFYLILSSNRDSLDPESVSGRSSRQSTVTSISDLEEEEEELGFVNESVSPAERVPITVMADLKAIADCMISSGYGKECVKIYNMIRKSIVDEGLYHLGVEKLSSSQVQKMDWEVLAAKMKSWLRAVKTAVKTLFDGERILCDHVFSSSATIRESCFAKNAKDGAMTLFGFPQLVAKCKKTPEKIFLTLDLYQAISDLLPEIEFIFSFESTSPVRLQAVTSLVKLGEAVRTMLTDFESAIQKDSSKSPVPNGGLHPLTRYVMNYISFLAEYHEILADIVADWPLTAQAPLPESYFSSDESSENPMTVRFAWLILILLCKLDGKAAIYKDVALSYIFLANNLQYIVVKVRSSNLKFLVGQEWISRHESKVKQYASNYERTGWSKVISSLPENPTAEISQEKARHRFDSFNAAFEEACKKQSLWVISDPRLRDEIKVSLRRRLGALYGEFYEMHRAGFRRVTGSESVVIFAPDDIANYLSDLSFGASSSSGSVSTSVSSSVVSSPSPSYLRGW